MSEKTHKQDDEELVIDFSKIKGWFKSSKKEKAEHKTAHEKSEHKTAHKSEHKAEHAHHKEHAHEGHAHKEHHEPKSHDHPEHKKEEDSPLDLKAVVPFMKKYGVVFLILIPIILTVFIRLQPAYLPVTDDWARSSVYDFYRNQMASQINQQYPNLPDANKKALLDAEFAKFTEQNQAMIDQQISATSQGFKDRLMYESGDSKYVYLGDIDSYFWLREVRKLERTGRNCDEIDYEKELCYVDTYTMAPLKSPSPLNTGKASPYSYTILYIYRVMKLFNPDTTIMQASFYTPLIYAILSAILAFLVGRAIAGNLAGLVTSVIISVNPIYLSRTMGSDNDPQNMFYPLLIVFFFIYALETKDLKKRLALGALTGLSIALYAWAWQGWWYMFDFLIGTMAILLGFHIVRTLLHNRNLKNLISNNEIQKTFTSLVTIFIASGIFIPIFTNSSTFLNAIRSPFWFMRTKIAALESFWPNVLVTVAEFNPGSLNTIVSQMGGKLLFFLGLAGILFVIVVRKKGKLDKYQKWLLGIGLLIYLFLVSDYALGLGPKTYMALLVLPVAIGLVLSLKSKDAADVKMAILLVIWFVATTYAALKGVRFTLLMVAAFGVAFGITIAMIYKFISQWISKELKINETITKAVIAVLLLLILITPVKAGYVVGKHFIPSVNDAWYDSLTNIRDNSEPDAIINSWWDFGHWFKYIADRRVTLDGSSQGGPPLHWLGKLMVTDDEQHSVGILRMLDCGSNTAFNELNAIINDTALSIDILDNIVVLERKEAGRYLVQNGLTNKEASKVLEYTHCEPPEDFFITSEDMVGKAGVWGHFGSWDFKRAEMYTKVKGKGVDEGKRILSDPRYNLTAEQADQYYYEIQTQDDSQWITPWPGYLSGMQGCENPSSEGIMVCTVGLSGQQVPIFVNLANMDATIPARDGDVYPHSIVYVTENGTEERFFDENTLQFSLVLIPDGIGYKALATHPYLANSMFTRLFYLNGHGLEHFDKFDDRRQVTGGRIIVWKVDWEGNDSNTVYAKVSSDEVLNQTLEESVTDGGDAEEPAAVEDIPEEVTEHTEETAEEEEPIEAEEESEDEAEEESTPADPDEE